MLSASPSSIFYTQFTISELKSKLVFHSNTNWPAPIDSEHKFNKTEIENCLSIGFNLGMPWFGTHSHNIVDWGINPPPPLKNTTPHFPAKPPL